MEVVQDIIATNTYEFVDKGCESVVAEHLSFMANKIIIVAPELQHLPSFYWLPKLDKQPYGARFIAASNECTKVQNPRRTHVRESLKVHAHSNYM